MAQKRRPSRQAGFEYLTLMVPAKFRADLAKQADNEGRTLSDVARERLLRPLAPDESRVLPWARAVGRLVGLLANELTAYSKPNKTRAMLRDSAAKLIERLGGEGSLTSDERQQAEMFAEYLWLRMMNAHEPSFNEGVAAPLPRDQLELMSIRQELGLEPSHTQNSKE